MIVIYDTVSDNVSLIRLSVSDGQKTRSSKDVLLIGICDMVSDNVSLIWLCIRWPENMQFKWCIIDWYIIMLQTILDKLANSVDPDQKQSDLGLHCLLRPLLPSNKNFHHSQFSIVLWLLLSKVFLTV